ncbi:MAG: hypothetical protein MAG451_00799 [Anaerolineales bacterium]|nr:hypothetical protein [Anaerolineales bacterium]
MTTQLTLTHLRFDCVAQTGIKLGPRNAGQRLRDALAAVMRRAVCPETGRRERPSPEHAAVCPVCWLLAAETEPGEVRRAYAVVPPRDHVDVLEPSDRFSFGLTLFGQGFNFLPYFVLAVQEVGRVGVGPGRGTFELDAIWAGNPLAGRVEAVMEPGDSMVHTPDEAVTWEHVQTATDRLRAKLNAGTQLRLHFLSPTRLVYDEALVKTADFGVLFRRMLERIDQLRQQFADEDSRPFEEVERLYSLADQVRVVEDNTEWIEVWSWSGRQRRKQYLSGIVGTATYRARDWDELLPWLVLGQATQVGKLAVKGNGVFEIDVTGVPGYWEWLAVSG